MNFIKRNRNKLTSIVLALGVLGITSFSAANLFSDNNSKTYSKPNTVFVHKIDENHAKLHCDSIKTASSDFLFSKTQMGKDYQYDVRDLSSEQKLYGFQSETDIKFDDGVSSNSELCVAIWGAVAAPAAVTTAGAIVTAAGAAVSAAPIAGAIIGAGGVAAANGVGFMAGAALAAGIAAAAAPVAVIGGAAVGLAGIG